ncbi:hypothetical protein ACFL2R_03345 [Patescibacteria group bacterium]
MSKRKSSGDSLKEKKETKKPQVFIRDPLYLSEGDKVILRNEITIDEFTGELVEPMILDIAEQIREMGVDADSVLTVMVINRENNTAIVSAGELIVGTIATGIVVGTHFLRRHWEN